MIRRMSEKKLAGLKGPVFSTISKRSESPRKSKDKATAFQGQPLKGQKQEPELKHPKSYRIPKVNLVAKAKRTARYRKMLSGKEYKAARAEAFRRAENQCEQEGRYVGDSLTTGRMVYVIRCGRIDDLHAHHLRYPKSRPLEARDLKILCTPHHEMAEAAKMHKTRMF